MTVVKKKKKQFLRCVPKQQVFTYKVEHIVKATILIVSSSSGM